MFDKVLITLAKHLAKCQGINHNFKNYDFYKITKTDWILLMLLTGINCTQFSTRIY